MSTYSSNDSLYGKEGYQEILLINGMDKPIEDEFERFNKNARMLKRARGYFYSTIDKNIYLNEFAANSGGGGYCPKILIDYDSHDNRLRFTNAANKGDWIPIYEHTKFLINSNDGSVWFSFQFLPKEAHYLKRQFAIISAENPSMQVQSESLNEKNNQVMEDALKNLGYEFYPSVGELCGHVEKSFIVYDVERDAAIALGNKFQQESIVFNSGEVIEIVECSTKKAPLSVEFKSSYL